MANNVEGLMGVSIEKVREMVDANMVVGSPMAMGDGLILIPVSKISYGFASGGSDLPANKGGADLFGGGAGAGINVVPVAFLTIKDGNVNILPVVSKPDGMDRLISMVPDLFDKVSAKKKNAAEAKETAE